MAAGDFVTVNDVKAYATSAQGNNLDDLIQSLITSESKFIATWLNRDLLEATQTETHDGEGHSMMPLNLWPISAVSAVVVDDQTWKPAVLSTDIGYKFSKRFLIAVNQRFPRGFQNVKVTYTGGYTKAALPIEIKQACIELVALRLEERKRQGQSSKSLNGDNVQFDVARDMPAAIAARLRPYLTYIAASV